MTRVFLYPLSFLKGRLAKADRFFIAKIVLTAHYKYVYDGQGNIVRSIDILGQKEYNYEYEEDRLLRATECDISIDTNEFVVGKVVVNTIKYYYDTEGKMTKKAITPASGSVQTIYYENSEDNTVVKFNAGGKTITAHSKTDSFGRKVFDELQLGTGFVSRQFHYYVGEVTEEHKTHAKLKSSATTQLVSQIVLSGGRTISYEYDEEERITEVKDTVIVDDVPVVSTTKYTYDALGQLVTETSGGVTTKFEYDNYGNILAKGVVDETGEIAEETKITYAYGDEHWHDLLTAYNGQPIAYDEQGNPTSYLGHTLTWEKGRQLKSFDDIQYTYNANGIRTSKTVDGIKHKYALEGYKILSETWDENVLFTLYDNEDSICGIIYNNVPFYFQKNLQGDIIGIVDADAKLVAKYTYDCWGQPIITQDNSLCAIATINPYRYRGYYFDQEIGMYYLQSRYYDPTVGRFVNSDEILYIMVSVLTQGINTFSYCDNDPVNRCDIEGNEWVYVLQRRTYTKVITTYKGWGIFRRKTSYLTLITEYVWVRVYIKTKQRNPYTKGQNVGTGYPSKYLESCALYVQYRGKKLGYNMTGIRGNGNQIASNGLSNRKDLSGKKGKILPSDLRSNSILSFTYNKGKYVKYGHVIYIEFVDGNNVYYSEGGTSSNGIIKVKSATSLLAYNGIGSGSNPVAILYLK